MSRTAKFVPLNIVIFNTPINSTMPSCNWIVTLNTEKSNSQKHQDASKICNILLINLIYLNKLHISVRTLIPHGLRKLGQCHYCDADLKKTREKIKEKRRHENAENGDKQLFTLNAENFVIGWLSAIYLLITQNEIQTMEENLLVAAMTNLNFENYP